MAFLAALPEIAEAVGGAGEAAGGAAGGAAKAGGATEAGGEGGGSLFKGTPSPGQGEQNKQQNVGEGRNNAFQSAFTAVRGALRGGSGGTD